MASLLVRPYVPADYLALTAPTSIFFVAPEEAARQYAGHPAFTATVDGVPVACAGIVIYWPGVAESWAVLSDSGRAHGYFVTRSVLRGLVALVRKHRLHRVQAKVMAGFTEGRRWVQAMGFEEEALLRAYGPKREDMISYVLFPKEMA